MKSSLTIGELAGRFGLATHVLRHWESVGLLAPDRAGCDQADVVAAIVRGDEEAARDGARAHLRDFSNSVRALLAR